MKDRKSKKSYERFNRLPHWVMEHPSYIECSHVSRSFLADVLKQFNGRNNGSLVVCEKAMKPRGWTSNATTTKCKRELLRLGLLVETRKGAKPNKAAWFAVGWLPLDVKDGLDINTRNYTTLAARKIEIRPPQNGVEVPKIAPRHGIDDSTTIPPHGAMRDEKATASIPPHGRYIEIAIPTAFEGECAHV